MGKRIISILLLILLIGVIASNSVSANNDSYQPGYIDWEINSVEHLFVEGMTEQTAILQREKPDQTEGGISLDPLFDGNIFSIQSEPIQHGFTQTVKMSVYFSVYLDGSVGPQTCTRQQSTSLGTSDASTTLTYTVSLAGQQIYQESVTEIVDEIGSSSALNFSGPVNDVNISANPGDTFQLTLSGVHNCLGSSVMVQWGGGPEPQNSGGILMIGQLYEPKMNMVVDKSNIPHIELDPILPWGVEDIKETKWEIWGPLRENDRTSSDNDDMIENSAGKSMLERQITENKSVLVWSGKKNPQQWRV